MTLSSPRMDYRWKWVVSFTLWPLNPRRNRHRYALHRRMGGPQSRFGRSRKISYPYRQSNPSSQSLYWLVLTVCLKRATLQTHLTHVVIDCLLYGRHVIFLKEDCFCGSSTVQVFVPIRIGSGLHLLADLACFSQFFTSPLTSQENNLLSDGTQASHSESLTTKHSVKIWCSHSGGQKEFYLLGYSM
jgi:hypothetical protein